MLYKDGARGQTRTGTLCGRGILNPLCLPISPLGHERNNKGVYLSWQALFCLYASFLSKSCVYAQKIVNLL